MDHYRSIKHEDTSWARSKDCFDEKLKRDKPGRSV